LYQDEKATGSKIFLHTSSTSGARHNIRCVRLFLALGRLLFF
jgi:hypothetical protein